MEFSDDRNKIQARVIEDSIGPNETRLTTLEVTFHRFVLAEFNTHRTLSRNSESSRAVPTLKRIEKVLRHPAIPVSFPQEQSGMSGGDEVAGQEEARKLWIDASQDAVCYARRMYDLGVHKSVINRALEPYLWHTVVVTATEWDGFFHQRLHKDAQPEIRLAAEAMREALDSSVPRFVNYGDWHLPFITEADREETEAMLADSNGGVTNQREVLGVLKRISTARCARTSYLTHDGVRSLEKDLNLYKRLAIREHDSSDPHHWSPLEHVATPCYDCSPKMKHHRAGVHKVHPGNFRNWLQHRHELDTSPYDEGELL